jgi:hypothetical protein
MALRSLSFESVRNDTLNFSAICGGVISPSKKATELPEFLVFIFQLPCARKNMALASAHCRAQLM